VFKDLFEYMKTQKIGRSSVHSIICIWFKKMLRCFFHDRMSVVFEQMKIAGAVVCGSAALWMVSYPCEWFPQNIDIICPTNTVHLFHAFPRHECPQTESIPVDRSTSYAIIDITRYNKTVTIIHSTSESCFPVLLCSRMTSQMIAASPDGLIIFYPSLTLHQVCFTSDDEGDSRDIRIPKDFIFMSSYLGSHNQYTDVEPCLRRDRRVHGMQGVILIGAISDGGTSSRQGKLAKGCHISYRLRDRCDCKSCLRMHEQ
jgi:hypothetical protein